MRRLAAARTAWLPAAAVVSFACGGSGQGAGAADPYTRRSTEIVLEQCARDGGSVLKLDADADGKPEVTRQMEGQRELCRSADLNFDGRPDRTSYFDAAGKLRRIETDFDRDGRVDEITLLQGGTLVERQRATTLAGRLDTWEFYEGGKLARTERDQNGDGIIDQWWEYPHPECPLIHSDSDGDGRPDPQSTIDYCKSTGYVPPPPPAEAPPKSPDFNAPPPDGGVSEVSNVSAEEAAARAAGSGGSVGASPSGSSTGGVSPGASK